MARQNAIRISKRTVDALTVESGDAVFWDRELTGFGVRVYATGRKVYVVQTRGPAGSLKRVTIGRDVEMTAETARRTAAEAIDRIRSGEDPFPAPPAPEATVADLAVSVRSGRGMGPVKRISHVEARPHKVLSFCW